MQVQAPEFSVVIPAHNASRTITECLDALAAQTVAPERFEIVVVDDGSTDGTAEVARTWFARHPHICGLVLTQPKATPAAARNRGVERARAPLVLFTDADCAPAPNWIEAMEAAFTDPEVVGAKGTYRTRQSALVARFVQAEYEDKYDLLATQPRIDFIDTYSAAYRRDVFLANDGFDEVFPYLEDQEFSFRLAQRGYTLVFQPEAVVYHRHAPTVRSYFRKKFIIGFWKAQVARRYPEKVFRDSHTPQVMKVQIALLGLSGLLGLGGLALRFAVAQASRLGFGTAPALWAAALLLFALLLASTLPFTLKAWGKDRSVALASPALLVVRALALGLGYTWGTLRLPAGVVEGQSTISGLNWWIKRTMDLIGALIGLVVLAVLLPFIAIAIKLDSPGPVFFVQERVGENGRCFRMVKFRSMVADAEERLSEVVDLDALPDPVFKIKDDPRVTRVGRFLRRTSLDELPQVWNVFKGEMSLVGPRPEELRIVQRYNDWHRRRLAVKPGLTGPMQINGRGDLPLEERVKLEIDYIEHYSVWRDIQILAKTIPSVISGKGAH
jgi:lipopolysaccharide/colanic/teichoic acid biosynthesis glycosyltransferase/glycosyltransferase involved in cell wall biosynthesis